MGFEPTTFGLPSDIEVRRAFPLRHRDSSFRAFYNEEVNVIIIYRYFICSQILGSPKSFFWCYLMTFLILEVINLIC
jgi:hypothetical protein